MRPSDDTSIIGMDIGGTSTRIVALDRELNVLGYSRLPGYATADPHDRSPLPLLTEAISGMAAGVRNIRVKVNLAGENSAQVDAAIRRAAPSAEVNIYRETTGEIGLFLGALFGCHVVVLVGTGSVALGRDGRGRRWVAGGMGPALSDEGSGYWIGHQAIRHTLKALDRRDFADLLIEIPPDAAGIAADVAREVPAPSESLDSIVAHRVRLRTWLEGLTRDKVAALAGAVVAKARKGSLSARQILGRAGTELAGLASAVAGALGLESPVRVLYSGGIAHAWDFISPSLVESLSRSGGFEARHAALSSGLAVAAALYGESGVSDRELIAIDRKIAAFTA